MQSYLARRHRSARMNPFVKQKVLFCSVNDHSLIYKFGSLGLCVSGFLHLASNNRDLKKVIYIESRFNSVFFILTSNNQNNVHI